MPFSSFGSVLSGARFALALRLQGMMFTSFFTANDFPTTSAGDGSCFRKIDSETRLFQFPSEYVHR
jgi:hypothetical protein